MTAASRLLSQVFVAASLAELRLSGQGRGPRVVFLPSAGRSGAALLRIHDLARAMTPLGWHPFVLPCRLSLGDRRRLIAAIRPEAVVMQGSRHALNRPHLYPGERIFYDIDDADFHLDHLAAPVRQAMAHVAGVIAGSRYIAEWCCRAGAPGASVVWTGTPVSRAPRPPQDKRPPVIAWAQSRPQTYLREHALVTRVLTALAARRPGVRLRLYDRHPGEDDGWLAPLRAAGVTVEWRKTLRYRDYLSSFDDVALGLAPLCPETPFSRGKSFGKVLAYLDRKVPVVGSDAGEHGAFFTAATGVITNDEALWVSEIDRLLDHAAARQSMADAAFDEFRTRLSIEDAARRVSEILGSGLAGPVSSGTVSSGPVSFGAGAMDPCSEIA